MSARLMPARTSSCTAWRSALSPRSLTCRTLATVARRAASRSMAAASAVVTVPLPRAMTTRTGVWSGSWNGAASRAADRAGLPAGSWSVLFSLMTLASDGRSRVARTAAATQAATMAQRNRTANRPAAAKNMCIMAKSPRCRP